MLQLRLLQHLGVVSSSAGVHMSELLQSVYTDFGNGYYYLQTDSQAVAGRWHIKLKLQISTKSLL